MVEFPKGNYTRVPFLLGNVDQEGLLFIYTAVTTPLAPQLYRKILDLVFDKGIFFLILFYCDQKCFPF